MVIIMSLKALLVNNIFVEADNYLIYCRLLK